MMKLPRIVITLIAVLACGVCFGKDTCFECHLRMEGMSRKLTNDIHYSKAISCDGCHGGDANDINQNSSMSATNGFKPRLKRPEIPGFCGHCHSDPTFMAKADPKLPTDQLAQYTNSVHGKALAAGARRVATCVDCHSVHDIRAPGDLLSKANPANMAKTCGKCHRETAEAYAVSKHARIFINDRRPACSVCHDAHATAPATSAMLSGANSVCAKCHRPGSPRAKAVDDLAQYIAGLEAAGPAKKDALDRARAAVHSLSLDAVKQAAEPPASAQSGEK